MTLTVYQGIPPHLLSQLNAYVRDGTEPSSAFVRAMLRDDIETAWDCGMEPSAHSAIAPLVRYLHRHVPHSCHGSDEAVRLWIKYGGLRGVHPNSQAARS